MTTVQRSADCNNSPKNAFAEDVVVSLLTQDIGALANCLTDDAVFAIVGERTVAGRSDILELISGGLEPALKALHIEHALSHGRVGAVNGRMVTGGAEKGFCFILEFASTQAERVRQVRFYRP